MNHVDRVAKVTDRGVPPVALRPGKPSRDEQHKYRDENLVVVVRWQPTQHDIRKCNGEESKRQNEMTAGALIRTPIALSLKPLAEIV